MGAGSEGDSALELVAAARRVEKVRTCSCCLVGFGRVSGSRFVRFLSGDGHIPR
jgi:hypothetical protein